MDITVIVTVLYLRREGLNKKGQRSNGVRLNMKCQMGGMPFGMNQIGKVKWKGFKGKGQRLHHLHCNDCQL